MNTQAKGTVKVWFASEWYGPADVRRDPDGAVDRLYFTNTDMSPSGWVHGGNAEVVITFFDEKQIQSEKVQALRTQLEQDRADSQIRQNALIRKISELEALTYEPATV